LLPTKEQTESGLSAELGEKYTLIRVFAREELKVALLLAEFACRHRKLPSHQTIANVTPRAIRTGHRPALEASVSMRATGENLDYL
jgi:hypothetical protein